MKIPRVLFLLGLLAAFAPILCGAAGEDTVTRASLKASYQSSLKTLVDAKVPPELLKQYGDNVDAVVAAFQKSGDLDGLIAAKNEKKRFEKEKTVPEESQDNLAPAIVKARQDYARSIARSEIDRNRKILALADKYSANLETLKKQLTQQGKIDEALATKDEIDRLRSSAEVTSAQFALAADADTRPQQPAPGGPGATVDSRDTPPTTEKILTARGKTIPCKGSTEGDWTRTTLTVKNGDTVTIKAKGNWACVGKSGSCGPDGYEDDGSREWRWEHSGHNSYSSRRVELNRRTSSEQYGALLCKIGNNGTIRGVGESTSFAAEEEGALFLDSNVAPGRESRKGCSGEMVVDIEVKKLQ